MKMSEGVYKIRGKEVIVNIVGITIDKHSFYGNVKLSDEARGLPLKVGDEVVAYVTGGFYAAENIILDIHSNVICPLNKVYLKVNTLEIVEAFILDNYLYLVGGGWVLPDWVAAYPRPKNIAIIETPFLKLYKQVFYYNGTIDHSIDDEEKLKKVAAWEIGMPVLKPVAIFEPGADESSLEIPDEWEWTRIE